MPALKLSEAQALAFRARRHHLLGPGAESPQAAARAIVGAQAQVVKPALWSLATRCEDPATAAELGEASQSSTTLVRTWGQRDTVHLYDAEAHWGAVIACLKSWPIGARGGEPLPEAALSSALQRIESLGRPVTRADLFDLIPEDFLAYMAARTGPGVPAQRGAAGRFIWTLARRGMLCAHGTVGREQSYVRRLDRYPALPWPELDPTEAVVTLARAYFAVNAPATVQDLAHFFGMRVSQARALMPHIEGELVEVSCGERAGLMARARDAEDLAAPAPALWPPRLLPRFDTLLMSHADKSWTTPTEADRPKIWAKAAQVKATVLHEGRLVATWKHKLTKKAVTITVQPLSGWVPGLEGALAADAERFAAYHGVGEAKLVVSG